jgi:hypothetical protein
MLQVYVYGFEVSGLTRQFPCKTQLDLGHCDLIEEIMIGEDKLIKFSGKLLTSSTL